MMRPTRASSRLLTLIACIALPGAACAQSDAPFDPEGPDGSLRVLFIGNSLTFFNDLPGMVEALLVEAGHHDLVVASLAFPNYGLQDHWARTETHSRIAEGWDVVVLQQGPSATEGRPSLIEYSEMFDEEIRAAGGIPALYMVWPAEARFGDFPGVSDSYATAADRVGGLLFPAGEAWLDAWDADPDAPLYGPDRFHPSPLGTYAAALVIYEQLSGEDPRELRSAIPGYESSATDRQTVRAAARTANHDHARNPRQGDSP